MLNGQWSYAKELKREAYITGLSRGLIWGLLLGAGFARGLMWALGT